ncbi:MAG: hypothetical protein ACTSQW_05735, partial [Promethearchaeota archaeon]
DENRNIIPPAEITKKQGFIINDKIEEIPNEIPIINNNKIVSKGVYSNIISIPKIKIPKIFVPKIKVHVPVIYKKSEEES